MAEFIDIKLKRAAIAIADELSYPLAAGKLNITSAELRRQMSVLEQQLCLYVFKPRQKKIELTKEGEYLIQVFRQSVSLHNRNGLDGTQEEARKS